MKFKIKGIEIFSKEETEEKNENSETDYLEEAIGATGTWQVGVAAIASLTRFMAVGNMTSIVFLTPAIKFTCIQFKNNDTQVAENDTCYDNCIKYSYNSEAMETTITSDFGLICEKAWLQSLSQTILMLGVVVGAYIFGWISDKFGRRLALLLSTGLNVVATIPILFVTDFWTFNCLRFIVGLASGGPLLSVSIVIELIGKRYREVAGFLCVLPDALSEAFLALIAYFFKTWKSYLLGFGVPCVLIFILVCLMPESPRWLVSNGKYDKAIEVLERAAKVNKRSTSKIKEIVMKNAEILKLKENQTISTSYIGFFRHKDLRYITISSICVWTVIGTGYYGIYQFVSLLSDNMTLTIAILGLIQIPLCPLGIMITKLLSRKASLIWTLSVTGCTMTALIFTPQKHWSTDLLSIIGFSASSVSFGIIYVYEAELFPTKVRNMAVGLCCLAAKGGAMTAPFIANMSSVWIPSAIFGSMSLVGAGICFTLPETKGKNLKDVSID